MVAVHARHAVFQALAAVPGILRADVELGRAELECADAVEEVALREAIEAAGFTLRECRVLPRMLPTL